jgi:hypothetical protein
MCELLNVKNELLKQLKTQDFGSEVWSALSVINTEIDNQIEKLKNK